MRETINKDDIIIITTLGIYVKELQESSKFSHGSKMHPTTKKIFPKKCIK